MSERMTRLKAPPGVASVRYGGKDWPVENEHVVLPAMTEAVLTRPAQGFKFPDEPVIVPAVVDRPTLHVAKGQHGRR